jgi:integrase
VAELYDRYRRADGDLDRMRAEAADVDLEPLVAEFATVLAGPSGGVSADTADHYVHAVRTLIGAGTPYLRSQLTDAALTAWVQGMTGVAPGTVRRRGAGMARFTAWLKSRGVLAIDPMRDVKLPSPGAPRVHFLDTADAKRLADAHPEPYRAFSALLAGSGIEVSVALALRVRDVDAKTREIRAAGTKTHARDRIVRVAEWAWPYIAPTIKGKLPDAKLFDAIPHRWSARDVHEAVCAALVKAGHPVYAGYTMRDHRHTWAVRAVRSGWPIEAVARQLGHVNGVLALKVYGRFQPTQAERERWERMAAKRDATMAKEESR